VFSQQISIIGSTMDTRMEFQNLLHFMSAAQIHPHIDRVYSLDEVGKAVEQMQAGNLCGKLVINVRE
jgi:zinc-binding alcohol dehydrogenase/oxidoreductase